MFDRLLVDRPKCDSGAPGVLPTALIEEGDGQENRRLVAFSFRFLNRPGKKRTVCAQKCTQTTVPKTTSMATIQSPPVVAFSVKGDGLNGVAFTASLSSVSV